MLVHNCKSCTFHVVRSVHNLDITFSAKRETVEDWENGKQLVKVLDQLDIFESCGKKAEIESLESLLNGQLRGNYLTKFYLPLSMDTHIDSKRAQPVSRPVRTAVPNEISKLSQPTYQRTFDPYSSTSNFSSQHFSQRDSGLESQNYSQHFSQNTSSQRYNSQAGLGRSLDPYSQGYSSQTSFYRF